MDGHHWMPGNRIWKTALAAAASWAAAGVLNSDYPFFAPLAAVLCMQATVEQSLTKGFQRVVGIIAGVVLAGTALRVSPPSWWSVGVLMLVALTVARTLRLPEYSVTQTGISALLMFTVGTDGGTYGLNRILETIIGAFTATLVNIVVAPPDYTRVFAESLKESAEELIRHCRELAVWLERSESAAAGQALQATAKELCQNVDHATARMEQAIHALKYSPFVRSRRRQLERYRALLHTVNRGSAHAMEIQRLLVAMAEREVLTAEERERWSKVFAQFAVCIEDWWASRDQEISTDSANRSSTNSMGLPPLTGSHWLHALEVEAHQLLMNFGASETKGTTLKGAAADHNA